MRVLYLTPAMPLPVGGTRLRAYQQIRLLSRSHEVTVAAFELEEPGLEAARVRLQEACRLITVERSDLRSLVRAVWALGSGLPFQVAMRHTSRMQRTLESLTQEEHFDVVFVHMVRMAPFCVDGPLAVLPRVLDYQDALSQRFRDRADLTRGPRQWMWTWEAERLSHYERSLRREFDVTMITSQEDASHIGGSGEDDIRVVPNAFELPERVRTQAGDDPPVVIFIGNMAGEYNESAVLYFRNEILPRVWETHPETEFWVIGAHPSPNVRELAGPRVTVTGWVDELGPYLDQATLAVCPIIYGSGIKNKVLEPMAAGLPVVGTPLANDGIEAREGQEILIADEPEDFADRIRELLERPGRREEMGRRGRELIKKRFSPTGIRAQLERVLVEARRRRGRFCEESGSAPQ